MSNRSRLAFLALAAVGSGAVAILAAPEAARAKVDNRIIDLRNKKKLIFGRTPAQWTEEWWQWAYSFPVSHNPGFDDTGARQFHGQRGPVWFLIAAFNSASIRRATKVPAGKPIFFPIINAQWDDVGQPAPRPVTALRRDLDDYMGTIDPDSVFVYIDGVPVREPTRGRIRSDVFTYSFPDDNVGQANGQMTSRGVYGPAVSDGYWIMIRPLPPGEHTIRSGGAAGPPYSFTIDTTYDIEVVDTETP